MERIALIVGVGMGYETYSDVPQAGEEGRPEVK